MSKLLSMMMSSSGGGGDETKYIYATDNAYIDTGISSGFSKVVIKGKVRNVTISNFTRFFGATNPSSYKGTYGYINTGTNELGLNYYKTNSTSASAGTCSYTVDEDFVLEGNYSIMGTPTGTIKILACVESSYSTSYYYSNEAIGISSIEFYDGNDNLLYQFKPATQNNVDGMIETVHNQFYANANSVGTLHIEGGTSQGTLNAEVVGSLTNNNGIYSGFSKDNYIKLQTPFVPSNAFEIKIKFKISSLYTTNPLFHSCIDLNNSGRYGICLVVENGKIDYFVSADGSSWLFDIYYNNLLSENTDYWIKFGWSGTEYYCDLSIDGTTYSRVISFSSNTAPTSSIQYTTIGRYVTSGLNGTIDSNSTSITDNGTEYYLDII